MGERGDYISVWLLKLCREAGSMHAGLTCKLRGLVRVFVHLPLTGQLTSASNALARPKVAHFAGPGVVQEIIHAPIASQQRRRGAGV